MEEWRAVLVDSLAMSLLNGHELKIDSFYRDNESKAVYLTKEGFKFFIDKMEKKLHTDNNYLSYVDYRVSFRRALDLQVNQLCQAIETGDPKLYKPVLIR